APILPRPQILPETKGVFSPIHRETSGREAVSRSGGCCRARPPRNPKPEVPKPERNPKSVIRKPKADSLISGYGSLLFAYSGVILIRACYRRFRFRASAFFRPSVLRFSDFDKRLAGLHRLRYSPSRGRPNLLPHLNIPRSGYFYLPYEREK